MKESIQIQYNAATTRNGKWPSDADCAGFEATCKDFMRKCNEVSYNVMRLFAIGLGLEDEEFFTKCHDIDKDDSMSTLRLLLYHDTFGKPAPEGHWRAGYYFLSLEFGVLQLEMLICRAHTDFDVLTLLFQRPGQSGLEICPGRSAYTSFAHGDAWTPVHFISTTTIVCNIGDMLMHLSSDRFKSTFHRVRAPREGEMGPRYSIAWFNQPNKATRIEDKKGKYPTLTAEEFIAQGMRRNYEALKGKGTTEYTASSADPK